MLDLVVAVLGVLLAVAFPLAVLAGLDYLLFPGLRHTRPWGRAIDWLRGQ